MSNHVARRSGIPVRTQGAPTVWSDAPRSTLQDDHSPADLFSVGPDFVYHGSGVYVIPADNLSTATANTLPDLEQALSVYESEVGVV